MGQSSDGVRKESPKGKKREKQLNESDLWRWEWLVGCTEADVDKIRQERS